MCLSLLVWRSKWQKFLRNKEIELILDFRKLRIFVETCSKTDDKISKSYYDELKAQGPWFNPGTSDKYAPVTAEIYQKVLYEFRIKQKSSRLMQIADIYLWPMCIAGYDKNSRNP